jgi:hypothetical protein
MGNFIFTKRNLLMSDILNWLKTNLRDIVEFLKSHAIEINIKTKSSKEVTRNIVITNLFFLLVVVILLGLGYGAIKVYPLLIN